jgi:hypothetical protein
MSTKFQGSHSKPRAPTGGRGRGYRATVAAGGQTCGPPVPWRGPRAQGQACLRGVCSAPSLLCLYVWSFILACLVLRVLPLLWAASLCLTPVIGSPPVGHSGGRSLASLGDCNESNQKNLYLGFAVKPAARLCPGEAPGPRARHVSWVCAVRPHCSICISAALSWLVCCYVCCRLPWAASLCLKPCCCFTPVGHSGGRSLAGLDDCIRAKQSKSWVS